MGVLLDRMLRYDAADLDMKDTVSMFRTMVETLPPAVFVLLPRGWRRDAHRLARAGHLTLPPQFPEDT
jgi:hypothetical protein